MKASLALVNASVLTQDPSRPIAESVAVNGEQILAVGSREKIREFCSSETRIIDCGGNTVLPGIIDSHFHLVKGSLQLAAVDLSQARSIPAIVDTLRQNADANEWILGAQLCPLERSDVSELTRHDLDQVSSERPVLIFSADHHIAWANTVALNRSGLLKDPRSEGNSHVVVGSDGFARGELREPGAFGRVRQLVPPITFKNKLELLKKGLVQARSFGITSVHNMDGDLEQLELLDELEREGQLSLRVLIPARIYPEHSDRDLKHAIAWGRRTPTKLIKTNLVKFLLDGVIEADTAFLLSDYRGKSGFRGAPNYDPAKFSALVNAVDRAGLQIATHAIGDAAVRLAVESYETLPANNGIRDRRPRIEHLELTDPADVFRMRDMGVIAAMQPLHAFPVPPEATSTNPWVQNVGFERLDRAFAWRGMLHGGVPLAFGSDWPVVSQNPFLGMERAIARQPWGRSRSAEALTLQEALKCYTAAGAFAEFEEKRKGMLRSGYLADIIALDRNLLKCSPQQVGSTKVVTTIFNGQQI